MRHDQLVALDLGHERVGHQQPPAGWFQRTSASTPDDLVRRQVDLRLVVQDELDRRRCTRAGRRSAPGAARARSSCSVANSAKPLPERLASYIARSARRSRSSMLSPCSGHERDADAGADLDALAQRRRTGSPKACWIFQTTVAAPADVGAGRQEHAELVAAEAGDRVGLAQARARGARPRVAAARRRGGGRACRSRSLNPSRSSTISASGSPLRARRADRLIRAVGEQHAIRECRELVVHRPVPQRLGVRLLLRLVAQAGDVEAPVAELHVAQPEAHRERRRRPCGGRTTRPCGRPRRAGRGAPGSSARRGTPVTARSRS